MKGFGGIIAMIVGILLLFCALGPFFLKLGFKLMGLAFNIVSFIGLLQSLQEFTFILKESDVIRNIT